jgi:hypothetical protein
MKKLLFVAFVLFFGSAAFAQDSPKVEVAVDYSFVHANPQNNNLIGTFNLNGGGGSIAYYFSKYIGILGEFQGYGSYTRTITILPTSPFCNGGEGDTNCVVTAQGNLFTYNVGPIFKVRMHHFEPFAEALFGGAHSNFYGNLYKNCVPAGCIVASKSPSNNAFDFIIGGGIDIPVNEHVAIRPVEFDYLLTRFGNAFTGGNNNQSNLRYQAGVVFRF